jgi:hypothetical protein
MALREADKIWLLRGKDIIEGAPEDLVLNGSLGDALLERNSPVDVSFDMESGEFRLHKEGRLTAFVTSSDKTLEKWTCRALERIGYHIESNYSGGLNVIARKRDGKIMWTVEKKEGGVTLDSIYDLSLYLRSEF